MVGLAAFFAFGGALFLFILNGIRSDVKEVKEGVSGVYPWAEDKFVSKDVCKAKMDSGHGMSTPRTI